MKKLVVLAVCGVAMGVYLLVRVMPKVGYLTDASIALVIGGVLFWYAWNSYRKQHQQTEEFVEAVAEVARELEPDQRAKVFELISQLNSQASAAAVLEARGSLKTGLRPAFGKMDDPPEVA